MRLAESTVLPALAGGLLLAVLAGCEPTDPMSHPFQQVPVASPAAVTAAAGSPGDGAPEDSATDARFAEFDEPFTISSEELRDMKEPTEEEAQPQSEAPSQPEAPPEAPPAPAVAQPTALSMAASAPMVAQVPAAPLGWAIRLVSTLPEAQPPRAILGLPSGQEIVVTPGSMVPEVGLVVLSIGTQGVQLARVQATGDHATVEPINLTPQYR